MTFNPGSLIANRYEVVRPIGRGGMGSVLCALDRTLDNETVAIKLLYPHLAREAVSFARFRNEVLVARKLAHPNVVRIYDFGHMGADYYYISMEYVAGGSLSKQIYQEKRALLSFPEVVRILRDIALGISRAHRMGIVHRDLKPDNILLTERREIKVTDFGLARSIVEDKGFTATGEAVGTPYYMAPEQLCGHRVDGRCDIYALGLIGYELVVGRRPFFDESYLNLAHMHLHEPLPDFAAEVSGVPKWYQEFVHKCAEKKPEKRFSSADEIVELLSREMEFLDGKSKMRRLPAVLSFYADTKSRPNGDILRRLPKIVGKSLLISALLIGSAVVVRSDNPVHRTFGSLVLRIGQAVGQDLWWLRELVNLKFKFSPEDYLALVKRGDVNAVKMLLDTGMAVDEDAGTGVSPLHLALRLGYDDLVNLLIERKANVNTVDEKKQTPLILAAQRKDEVLVKKLIERGASLWAKGPENKTALIFAAAANNKAAITLLIDKIDNIALFMNSADSNGRTALFHAVMAGAEEAVNELFGRTVTDVKVDVNNRDSQGQTPLFYSVALESGNITKLLLAKGANLEPKIMANANRVNKQIIAEWEKSKI